MKHLILGTAGHVDHGKTALVKALTGIDCDTHKEEKRRGITINLGFAHLKLPDNTIIGIVDVPGHRDFVHTMVSGAAGIDIALLVVAADGGIMPQTREHVRIMHLLGIKTGIIALTRVDLADPGMISLAFEELTSFVRGSFLEGCPVVKVSAVTGEGIDTLKKTIADAVSKTIAKKRDEGFRMYIDRIFSIAGFGTVVTGSVQSGVLKTGAKAYLIPTERELRVRRLERYGQEVEEVFAGDRASLNLVGLSREEFVRGMMVADRQLRTTTLVDARLELFEESRRLSLWSQELFLMGTYEAQARVHLIDRDFLAPGGFAVAQIHLPQPCIAKFGDRFVLRGSSGDMTLGGGEVIDFSPLRHRRRPKKLLARLGRLAKGSRVDFMAEEVRKENGPLTLNRLAENLNITPAEAAAAIGEMPDDIRALETDEHVRYFISVNAYETLKARCLSAIEAHHRENQLLEDGKTVEDLYGIVGLRPGHEDVGLLRFALNELRRQGALKAVNHTWAIATHAVNLSSAFSRHVNFVENYVRASDMHALALTEIEPYALKAGIDKGSLKQILRYLADNGRVYAVEGVFIHADVISKCRSALVEKLKTTPAGLTVAQFRDLVRGNRKMCVPLLSLFDSEGITERQGDVRVLKK